MIELTAIAVAVTAGIVGAFWRLSLYEYDGLLETGKLAVGHRTPVMKVVDVLINIITGAIGGGFMFSILSEVSLPLLNLAFAAVLAGYAMNDFLQLRAELDAWNLTGNPEQPRDETV